MEKNCIRFIVLIPHRDTRKNAEHYSGELFRAGFSGAYGFPFAAPVFITDKPFSGDELKRTALFLREASTRNGFSGKFTGTRTGTREIAPGLFLGSLDVDVPLENYSPDVRGVPVPGLSLALTVLKQDERDRFIRYSADFEAGLVSFRAAAVANMVYRYSDTRDSFSCSWETGRSVWLPSYKGE